MISDTLKSAYRYHRTAPYTWQGRARSLPNAGEALQRARDDVTLGKARYPSDISAAVCWQHGKPGLAFIQSIKGAGLRYVGRASIEGRRGAFSTNGPEGWITDPHGEYAKDGSGLCWGVVYQLPGRNGKARFVPGYIMGGDSDAWAGKTCGGPTPGW